MDKIKEIQRELVQYTKQVNTRLKDPQGKLTGGGAPETMYAEELKGLQTALQAARESAKYWESLCQSQSQRQSSEAARRATQATEIVEKQYRTELEAQKLVVQRLTVNADIHL
jgi:hypothetical protein